MSTHDYVIANASGSSVRSDLNNALAAIVSNNSSSSEPSTKYAYMLWVDTTNNLIKLRNSANNAWITLFTTAGGLDVDAASNFNEDVTFTGASANVTWDKSADDLIFNDNAKAVFGTSSDGIAIYHDGSNSYINEGGTGHLKIRSDDAIKFQKTDGSWIAIFNADASTDLYYSGSKKFETTAGGTIVTGTLTTTGTITGGGHIKTGSDTGYFFAGASNDLQIFHNGSNSFIENAGTGDLYIQSASGNPEKIFLRPKNGENSVTCDPDGKVAIYYNNSKKFETTSDGIYVSGSVTAEVTGTNTDAANFVNSGSTSLGTQVKITNDSTTPADGDQTGYLQFNGNDSNGNATIYNAIIGYTDDVSDTEEDGSLKFFCRYEGGFAQRLAIAANGTFTGSGSNDISDQRLKDNIATVVDPIGKIKALKGRTFTWKPEANLSKGTKYGFIAQEVEAVVSDLVDNEHGLRQFDKDNNLIPQDEKAKINKDEGTTEAKAVHATGVVPILVEALKEALTKIETLETKVAALEAK